MIKNCMTKKMYYMWDRYPPVSGQDKRCSARLCYTILSVFHTEEGKIREKCFLAHGTRITYPDFFVRFKANKNIGIRNLCFCLTDSGPWIKLIQFFQVLNIYFTQHSWWFMTSVQTSHWHKKKLNTIRYVQVCLIQ